jgi:hypothetical protein
MAQDAAGAGIAGPAKAGYWLELISSLLLSVAVVATAYSAYEATRWGGVQSTAFAEAGSLMNESVAASSAANTEIAYDSATFGQFVFEFRDTIRQRRSLNEARALAGNLMRDEFLVYLDQWLARDPFNDRSAPRTPFDLETYTNAKEAEAARLVDQADAKFEEARDAGQTSDDYVLATVFFASVLFFTGISAHFDVLRLRGVVLALAFIGMGIGLVRMLTLPFE